jgi:3-deoxy-D-manno-octulosonic-acid transferase
MPPPATRSARLWAGAASLSAPALRLLLRHRARIGKEDPARRGEREGIDATPRPAGKLLWMHAASVGEALSVLPVLQALPETVCVLFTTGTLTSARLLALRLPELGLSDRVLHRFAPLDVPAWAARFLDHWRPDAACFLESELWPNLLSACRARGIPACLMNARLSVRSAARWCNLPGFAAEVVGGFDWIAAQSEADAMRLRSLGGRAVDAPGNLKDAAAELPADAGELARLGGIIGGRPAWLAASTHPGDEQRAARIHAALAPAHPGLITAIVPRHPERGAAIAAELAGLPLRVGGGVPRRSLGDDPAPGLWIADTLGELGVFYRLFPIVVMGKSFPPGGGQNPLEPARLGCAIACGPAMGNFVGSVTSLAAAGGMAVVESEAALTGWIGAMLADPARRAAMGEAARKVAAVELDLPARMAARLVALMG